MPHAIRPTLCFGLTALALLAGCKKKDAPPPPQTPAVVPAAPVPLAIAGVTLGKGVDASKMVTTPSSIFGVRDTIYASVYTQGVGANATVGAKWEFVKQDGSTVAVNETSQTITTTGPAYTEFHISKASAWPKGKYRVTVRLDGAASAPVEFDIQ
jgi:hypothetical protein